MSDEENKKKEIEVVAGDGKDLKISAVYDHIKTDKQKNDDDKKKTIIIPEGSSSNNKKNN